MKNFYNYLLFPQLNRFLGTPNASGNPDAWTVNEYWVQTAWDDDRYCGYTNSRIIFDMNIVVQNITTTRYAAKGNYGVEKLTKGEYGPISRRYGINGCEQTWKKHYKTRDWSFDTSRHSSRVPGCFIGVGNKTVTYNSNPGYAYTSCDLGCLMKRVTPVLWIIVGFSLRVSDGNDFEDKTPNILKVDPLNMDESPAERANPEEAFWSVAIPVPTKKRQKYTFLFDPDIREDLSKHPKFRFEGTDADGKKDYNIKIALHYGIRKPETFVGGSLSLRSQSSQLRKGSSMEKGQGGCTSGVDPVDCQMNSWSELGSYKDGVFTPGRCTTDNERLEDLYGKKCAYYADGKGPDETNGDDPNKKGIMYKIRSVKRGGQGGGDDSCKNESTQESEPVACNREDCPINCQYGPWGEWEPDGTGETKIEKNGTCAGRNDCGFNVLFCERTKTYRDGWRRKSDVKKQGAYGGTKCSGKTYGGKFFADSKYEYERKTWYETKGWNC
tara:strand:- start:192 stop:1679 length:1488 start_codon:yes stop_codon:yes gene_type:complete